MASTSGPMHPRRLPGESGDYRAARDDLLRAEVELKRQTEAVAKQLRALPPGGPLAEDYSFHEWDPAQGQPRPVRFSDLFTDGRDTLAIYSFMFKPGDSGPLAVPCPICTSIIDAIDGEAPHITNKSASPSWQRHRSNDSAPTPGLGDGTRPACCPPPAPPTTATTSPRTLTERSSRC